MQSQYLRSVEQEIVLPQTLFSSARLLHSKIANIGRLVSSLNAAVADLESLNLPELDEQFDFYDEVERFEINLIKSALRVTGGSQVKAARLLKLNATTLNAKMKTLKLLPR
jgi:DNA-binding NtrC family response regulator